MRTGIAIIGGGLSGLYTAWRLQQAGVRYKLIEARERLGGRIHGFRVELEASPDNS